jgi:hypothetical protein
MTAEEINLTTLNRKDAKKRSRCKAATPCIQAAESILAQASMGRATSVQKVLRRHDVQVARRETLR